MFDADVLAGLLDRHADTLERLRGVESLLAERFASMQDPLRALSLAVASGETLLFIGPPGTAKSRLIRAFCGTIGMIDEDDPAAEGSSAYFEYLLTPFTEPGELFGFYDIQRLYERHQLVRDDAGMMQQAAVVFLDEVFNGSSAILNSILSIMNERVLHDGGRRVPVALECLFAATNHVPTSPELRAIFDRFLLRCEVHATPAEPESLSELVGRGWPETYGRRAPGTSEVDELDEQSVARDVQEIVARHELRSLLSDLRGLREDVRELTRSGELRPQGDGDFYRNLAQHVEHVRQYGLSDMSNRRIVKMTHVMLIHRLLRAREEGGSRALRFGAPELALVPRYFLDRTDEVIVEKLERLAWRMD